MAKKGHISRNTVFKILEERIEEKRKELGSLYAEEIQQVMVRMNK